MPKQLLYAHWLPMLMFVLALVAYQLGMIPSR